MRCPHCGEIEDKVIESRQNASGSRIRRRRECLECGYRFTSYEEIEEKPLMVVKRDGRREVFSLEKLERGIQRSLQKRPVSQNRIDELIHQIEDEAVLRYTQNREISSQELGALVLGKLYKLDSVGYVRFASVYRMFKDVDEFVKEIEKLSEISEESVLGNNGGKNNVE